MMINLLKKIRTFQGYSKTCMAKKLKISLSYLSLIEAHKRICTEDLGGEMCKILKISFSLLEACAANNLTKAQEKELKKLLWKWFEEYR